MVLLSVGPKQRAECQPQSTGLVRHHTKQSQKQTTLTSQPNSLQNDKHAKSLEHCMVCHVPHILQCGALVIQRQGS